MPPTLVERNDLGIRSTNLEIQFRTSEFEKTRLCAVHQKTRETASTKFRADRQMMDPASNTVESREDGPSNAPPKDSNEKEIRLDRSLPLDDVFRRVPRRIACENLSPELDDGVVILRGIGSNFEILVGHSADSL